MAQSLQDLAITRCTTSGDVPAKLVGATTTVMGSYMYLFGGIQFAERHISSDLYRLDLETLSWKKLASHPNDDVPCPRYFHSADAWGSMLVIFGGMSHQSTDNNVEKIRALDDVRLYDTEAGRWLPDYASSGEAPQARYGHLSTVTADRLFVIGGQDRRNEWLDDICLYDIPTRKWVQRRSHPRARHSGSYRSMAVAPRMIVHIPPNPQAAASASSDKLVFHSYSALPTNDHPADVYLYSNYNFKDMHRDLEIISPLPGNDFTMTDSTQAMSGTVVPPGFRFPTGAILGNHLVVAGTSIEHSQQSYMIWTLNLTTLQWSRIDVGSSLDSGSWFRGCLAPLSNKFYIFGDKDGNRIDDYGQRLLSWENVVVLDLEAFGVYQPPQAKLDISMQELGLTALQEGIRADFDVICADGRKISCSRKLLEDRWPWFKEQRKQLLEAAMNMPGSDAPVSQRETDPFVTLRALHLPSSYQVSLALVQYFYAQALVTPIQQTPAVLNQLLALATHYGIEPLDVLARHAMHLALDNPKSADVYEAATSCSCRSLQVRAMRLLSSAPKHHSDGRLNGSDNGGRAGSAMGYLNMSRGNQSTPRPRRRPSEAQLQANGGLQGIVDKHPRPSRSHVPPLIPLPPPPAPPNDWVEMDKERSQSLISTGDSLVEARRRRPGHGHAQASVSPSDDDWDETDRDLQEMSDLLMGTSVRPRLEVQMPAYRNQAPSRPRHGSNSNEYFDPIDTSYTPTDSGRSPSSNFPPTPSMSYTPSVSSSSRSVLSTPVTPPLKSSVFIPHGSKIEEVQRERRLPSPPLPPYTPPAGATFAGPYENNRERHREALRSQPSDAVRPTTSTFSISSIEYSPSPTPEVPVQTKKGIKSLFGSGGKPKGSDDGQDAKEMKRRKAEEKRARTERLAEELKAKADARKRARDGGSSGERKVKEPATMYGGFVM